MLEKVKRHKLDVVWTSHDTTRTHVVRHSGAVHGSLILPCNSMGSLETAAFVSATTEGSRTGTIVMGTFVSPTAGGVEHY